MSWLDVTKRSGRPSRSVMDRRARSSTNRWTPHWTEEDLRNAPSETREPQALELATAEARRPFDLEQGPLLRILLIQLGEEDHVFVMSTHHIISDQWSYGVIARELVKCYNAFYAGKPVVGSSLISRSNMPTSRYGNELG